MSTYTHPADVPSVAPMRAQLDAARAIRAASFFVRAHAAREDAVTLSPTPTVLAPMYANGAFIGNLPARIIGLISRETHAYLVKFLHNGETRGAFGYELVQA